MNIRDLFRLFRGQRVNALLLILYLTLTLVLSNLLFASKAHVEQEQMHHASLWDGKQVYATYDTLYEHKALESAYLKEPGSQMRVQRYVDALEADARFPYYICGAHGIEAKDNVKIPGENVLDAEGVLKAHQVNRSVMRDFPPAILYGRSFAESDYLWQPGDDIPVLAGYAWRDALAPGDRFTGTFMTSAATFHVIGIAGENTYFPLFDQLVYEDDFLIMPTLRCMQPAADPDRDFFEKIVALQNASGFFRLPGDMPLSELATHLDTLGQQYGVFETKLLRVDQARLLLLAISSDKHRQVYGALMLALAGCALLCMITLSRASVRKNARTLSIFYLAGAGPWQIALLLMGQGLVLYAAAATLSVLITLIAFPSLQPAHAPLHAAAAVTLCLCTLPALRAFLLQPTAYLKKE